MPNLLGFAALSDSWGFVWIDNYGAAPADGAVRPEGDCTSRVIRGGHWRRGGSIVRSAMGTRIYTNYRRPTIGFRVAAGQVQ